MVQTLVMVIHSIKTGLTNCSDSSSYAVRPEASALADTSGPLQFPLSMDVASCVHKM